MTEEKKPQLVSEQVREFVIAGHGNLERVKEMLAEEPRFINAAWDWGGGDFETALGGAAHVGSADVARYLLEHGADMTLYAAAMLGELDLVKAILNVQPNAHHNPGAHGIPLIVHAQQGGAAAVAVVEYLRALK